MIDSLKQRLLRARQVAQSGVNAARTAGGAGLLAQLSPSGVAAFMRRSRGARPGPHTALLLHACNKPEQPAVADSERRLSWAALDRETNQLAHALAARGVRRGDRVVVMLRNGVEAVVAGEALARLGAVAVRVSFRLKAPALAGVLRDMTPAAAIYHRDYALTFDRARQGVATPGDDALVVVGASADAAGVATAYDDAVSRHPGASPPDSHYADAADAVLFTAGLTGPARAIRRPLGESPPAVLELVRRVGMTADDRHLVVCPLFDSATALITQTMLALGASNILVDHFDAERFLAAVERERITGVYLNPTMLHRLLALPERVRRQHDASSLRWVICGGAPLPAETASRFQEAFGYMLWNAFGATELGLVTLAGPYDHAGRPGTVGQPLSGHRLSLRDAAGKPVPPGDVGELWVARESSAGDERPEELEYVFAGDLARVDDQGHYFVLGPRSDAVATGGADIYPSEVEDRLYGHPAVLECAVVEGAVDGETAVGSEPRIEAFVVPRSRQRATLDELRGFVDAVLAAAGPVSGHAPTVAFVDSLPHTPTGKLNRPALRKGAR